MTLGRLFSAAMQPFQRVIHAFALIAIVCATVIASSIIGLSLIVSRFVAWEAPRDGGWLLLPIATAVLGMGSFVTDF